MSTKFLKLIYSKNGDPRVELALVEEPAPVSIQPGEVLVRTLYSPVNPSDILMIQGRYPLHPPLPAVPGLEGVAEVVRGGEKFKPGDRVLIRKPGIWGMWKQQGIVEEEFLVKIPNELPLEAAATLIINPCTAYLMLKYIVPMKPGDVLIQNAANSALGQILIQFAKASEIKTINVIRKRPNLKETVDMLKNLGADAVITDEDLKKGLEGLNLGLPAPKLALECIGGQAAEDLASAVGEGGTMAVYGSLSNDSVHISQSEFIYRSINVRGFWLSKWVVENKEEFDKVVEKVSALYISGKLKLPKIHKFPLAEWKEAVTCAMQGFTNEKVLLQFN